MYSSLIYIHYIPLIFFNCMWYRVPSPLSRAYNSESEENIQKFTKGLARRANGSEHVICEGNLEELHRLKHHRGTEVVLCIHDILLLHKYNICIIYNKCNVHIYRICVWTIINKEKEAVSFRVKVAWQDVAEGLFRGAKGRKRKEPKCYNYISFKIYKNYK